MTDKLKDIREGDTVEVTFRGVVDKARDGCFDVLPEGGDSDWTEDLLFWMPLPEPPQ